MSSATPPDIRASAPASPKGEPAPVRTGTGLKFADLLAGLPALVAGVTLLIALWTSGSNASLASRYEKKADDLYKAQDYPGALVCFKRLLAFAPERADVRYNTAVLLEKTGDPARAESMARALAPEKQPGYPPAQLWMARHIMADRARLAVQANVAEGHLRRFLQAAKKDSPEAREAVVRLGELCALTGRLPEAKSYLESTAKDRPELLLELARINQQLEDREASLSNARAAMKLARARAEAQPDDRVSRLIWASAATILGDFPTALSVLDRGLALTGDDVFRKSMASVCLAWAIELEKGGSSKDSERLAVIDRGLAFDAGNAALLAQLANIMGTKGTEADKARVSLRSQLAVGKNIAMSHFLLGNDAWARDKPDEARIHWEEAYKLDPKMPIVTNNLAWLLAFREPTDVPRALTLIENALILTPNDTRLRGTHGQILTKAGRWKEAIAEMEIALRGGQTSADLHSSLADSYEHLGMHDMALEHRRPR
jgi:tetratricopeptide (TPR) repeat protein